MKPDLLIAWPTHIDYPLFRYNLRRWRDCFRNIIVCFSNGLADRNVEDFVRKNVDAIFTRSRQRAQDWRQDAIIELLQNSTSERVLFLEQDFLIKDRSFLEKILNKEDDFIGYREGLRLHPAFVLIKRALINRTARDFSAYPDEGYDHFGRFFEELSLAPVDIRDLGFKDGEDYYHMASLTQNYHCFREHQPFYKPSEFLTYNSLCLELDISHQIEFRSLEEGIRKTYGDGDSKMISSFFPNS